MLVVNMYQKCLFSVPIFNHDRVLLTHLAVNVIKLTRMTTFIKCQCLQLPDAVLISSGLDHYPLCLQGFKTRRRVHLSVTIFWLR